LFRFKQFTIHQDRCAIKVCTDSCLFGAWTAQFILDNELKSSFVLDIGAGTGLLSLMLAQKLEGNYTAIEIDSACAAQAKDNIDQSKWKHQIQIIHTDVLQYESNCKFDFIISNPPFFENDLRSDSGAKNAAKHDTTLTFKDLVVVVERNLLAGGVFAILLPFRRTDEFINIANERGLRLNQITRVRQTPKHEFFRSMLIFSFVASALVEDEIIVKETDGNYSSRFTSFLKDYYLYL
jgi:tRNA1Val (adenine37-N6)-methyltransferase